MSPLVSVLIPVYNREKLIGPCISSALAQTYSNIEIIVVDNDSRDDTYRSCLDHAASDRRVRVYKNERNIGPVANWIRCVSLAKGSLARLLFSDDMLITNDAIGKGVAALEDPDVAFALSAVLLGTSASTGQLAFKWRQTRGVYSCNDYLNEAIFGSNVPVSPCAALFRTADLRRNVLLTIPSAVEKDFASHGAGIDQLVYLLTAVKYRSMAFDPEAQVLFRAHNDSISCRQELHPRLHRGYRQARIWFCQHHRPYSDFCRLIAKTWHTSARKEKSGITPRQHVADYAPAYETHWLRIMAKGVLAEVHERLSGRGRCIGNLGV